MKRPSADPALIFGVSFLLAGALWCPTLGATLRGNTDITDAGIRYFCALAMSWAAVYAVAAIVTTCARRLRRPTPPPAAQPAVRDRTRRAARDDRASNAA